MLRSTLPLAQRAWAGGFRGERCGGKSMGERIVGFLQVSPAPLPTRPSRALSICCLTEVQETRRGGDAPSLPRPPHCQSQAQWRFPSCSPRAGGRQGSRPGPAPAANNKVLAVQRVRGSAERQKGSGASPPFLDLTSSSHSLCCFFLAMSRAVSPASFTVRGKVKGHGQGQKAL